MFGSVCQINFGIRFRFLHENKRSDHTDLNTISVGMMTHMLKETVPTPGTGHEFLPSPLVDRW
jgi:hypothetical protein